MPAISDCSPASCCWSLCETSSSFYLLIRVPGSPLINPVLFFRHEIHPGAGREIVGRLGPAVKHDEGRRKRAWPRNRPRSRGAGKADRSDAVRFMATNHTFTKSRSEPETQRAHSESLAQKS
jgi:hypothetical protein